MEIKFYCFALISIRWVKWKFPYTMLQLHCCFNQPDNFAIFPNRLAAWRLSDSISWNPITQKCCWHRPIAESSTRRDMLWKMFSVRLWITIWFHFARLSRKECSLDALSFYSPPRSCVSDEILISFGVRRLLDATMSRDFLGIASLT